jgi:hypothetical protein
MTRRLFGKEFLGAEKRGEEYRGVYTEVQTMNKLCLLRCATAAA